MLEFIGKKEGLQIPPGFTGRIAAQSNRSLRRAILLFETCRVQQLRFLAHIVDLYQLGSLILFQYFTCKLILVFCYFNFRYPFTSNQAIPPMDWEQYITEIASDILQEQSPKRCDT